MLFAKVLHITDALLCAGKAASKIFIAEEKERYNFITFRYEFDPNRYEGEDGEVATINGEKTVIPAKDNNDLDKQLSLEVDKNLLTPSPTSLDRSKLKIDLTPDGTEKRKKKLPPRPEDYDYYWYQDEDGTWRNEYDDQGYEFADDEYDPDEAEEIVQAQKDEGKARAEAELAASGSGSQQENNKRSSLTGLETIPEQIMYDEYGQPIVMDEAYRKDLARQRWHWAFTKIVQVSLKLNIFDFLAPKFTNVSCLFTTIWSSAVCLYFEKVS